jgi:hypothetical protein
MCLLGYLRTQSRELPGNERLARKEFSAPISFPAPEKNPKRPPSGECEAPENRLKSAKIPKEKASDFGAPELGRAVDRHSADF